MEIEEFYNNLEKNNIIVTDSLRKQFELYCELLLDYNKKVNLTSITEMKDVYAKHFYDSLLPLFDRAFYGEVIDVGSGAGFPGIPLKIVKPEIKLTIVDAAVKKIKFLEILVEELQLDEVKLVNKRAEEYGREKRESFDFVVSRAVADLPQLAELCLPFAKVTGEFWALKGPNAAEEVSRSLKAITKLGGKVKREYAHSYANQQRINVVIEKIKETPLVYPRRYALISKQPL